MLFSELANFVYIGLSLIIGIRLLRLYASSRQLPELLVAISLLTGGFLFSGSVWLTSNFAGPWSGNESTVAALRSPLLAISSLSVALFAWRTRRRSAAWAPLAVVTLALPMIVWIVDLYVGSPILPFLTETVVVEPLTLRAVLVRGAFTLCWAWAALEMTLYYRTLRRRRTVGLDVDPLVANRAFFLSVSFWSFAVFWPAMTLSMVYGRNALFLVVGVGTFRALGLWLALLPPEWLTQRLRDRSALGEAA